VHAALHCTELTCSPAFPPLPTHPSAHPPVMALIISSMQNMANATPRDHATKGTGTIMPARTERQGVDESAAWQKTGTTAAHATRCRELSSWLARDQACTTCLQAGAAVVHTPPCQQLARAMAPTLSPFTAAHVIRVPLRG